MDCRVQNPGLVVEDLKHSIQAFCHWHRDVYLGHGIENMSPINLRIFFLRNHCHNTFEGGGYGELGLYINTLTALNG